jgi:hypothetical protein
MVRVALVVGFVKGILHLDCVWITQVAHTFSPLEFIENALDFRCNTPISWVATWVETCILGNKLSCRKKVLLNGGAFEGATLDSTAGCKVHRIPRELPEAPLAGGTRECQVISQVGIVYKLKIAQPSGSTGVKFFR